MKYSEQLKDKRWLYKRVEILTCALFKCELCGHDKPQHLVVHHKRYINGLMAWEYEREDLIVLCNECHNKVHKSLIFRRLMEDTRLARQVKKYLNG